MRSEFTKGFAAGSALITFVVQMAMCGVGIYQCETGRGHENAMPTVFVASVALFVSTVAWAWSEWKDWPT